MQNTPLRRLQHFLHAYPTTIPVHRPRARRPRSSPSSPAESFFTPFNLSLILQQVTIIGIARHRPDALILTAGIDLSVGAIMVLSSVVMGKLAVQLRRAGRRSPSRSACWSAWSAAAINGVLVTRLRLPPFIVTLGTWSIFGALNLLYSRSETIRPQDIEATAPFLQWMGSFTFDIGSSVRITAGLAPDAR